jgi:hypothetical protein
MAGGEGGGGGGGGMILSITISDTIFNDNDFRFMMYLTSTFYVPCIYFIHMYAHCTHVMLPSVNCEKCDDLMMCFCDNDLIMICIHSQRSLFLIMEEGRRRKERTDEKWIIQSNPINHSTVRIFCFIIHNRVE